jgi:hypothetical protein
MPDPVVIVAAVLGLMAIVAPVVVAAQAIEEVMR